jgi:hypothetical protein
MAAVVRIQTAAAGATAALSWKRAKSGMVVVPVFDSVGKSVPLSPEPVAAAAEPQRFATANLVAPVGQEEGVILAVWAAKPILFPPCVVGTFESQLFQGAFPTPYPGDTLASVRNPLLIRIGHGCRVGRGQARQ